MISRIIKHKSGIEFEMFLYLPEQFVKENGKHFLDRCADYIRDGVESQIFRLSTIKANRLAIKVFEWDHNIIEKQDALHRRIEDISFRRLRNELQPQFKNNVRVRVNLSSKSTKYYHQELIPELSDFDIFERKECNDYEVWRKRDE